MSDSSQPAARSVIYPLVAAWALRIALSAAFLAAVADRFGLCGGPGANNVAWGAWQPFVDYTSMLLFYLPPALVSVAAATTTAAEVILGVWLLSGWHLRLAALASALLLLSFGVCMLIALGWKAPLNYSVFTAMAAALALAALDQPQSNDAA